MGGEERAMSAKAGRVFLILVCAVVFGAGLALHGQQPPGGRFVDGGRFVRDTQCEGFRDAF